MNWRMPCHVRRGLQVRIFCVLGEYLGFELRVLKLNVNDINHLQLFPRIKTPFEHAPLSDLSCLNAQGAGDQRCQ